MHFYIKPVDENHPYTANAKVLIVSSKQRDITITLSDLALDPSLDYETVGCKDFLASAFAIIAGGISAVICGPCSLPVAIIAFVKAGDLVNGIIQGKIYSFMNDFNQTIVIKAH